MATGDFEATCIGTDDDGTSPCRRHMDCYSLLTNIQGFDSFNLDRSSSEAEIRRAYETQKLIWSPERNPGDQQAERIYHRMQASFETLMDPVRRASHDAALEAGGAARDAEASEAVSARGAHDSPHRPLRQPPPDDLGAPPSSAHPFAYIDQDPNPGTPAAKAGLRCGDALLRMGEAASMRAVQAELQANVGLPVPTLVIDAKGRFLKKWVVPWAWNPEVPSSLLGAVMSDECPPFLRATHPALVAERERERSVAAQRRALGQGYGLYDEEAGSLGVHDEGPRWTAGRKSASRGSARGRSARRRPAPPSPWPRFGLGLLSVLGLGLSSTVALYPAHSNGIFSLWDLTKLDCDEVVDYVEFVAFPPSAPPASPTAPTGSAWAGPPWAGGAGATIRQVVATGMGMYLFKDSVKAILVAALVSSAISALGFLLACCRPSGTRGLLAGVFLVAGMPCLLFLVLVSVSASTMRSDAEAFVAQYWRCLRTLSPNVAPATLQHDIAHSASAAAGVVLAAAVLHLGGMVCACRLIGWRVIARNGVFAISLTTGLVGLLTTAVGVALKATSKVPQEFFDGLVLGVGLATLLVSAVGAVGARRESRRWLRLHVLLVVVALSLLAGVTAYLLVGGSAALTAWVARVWSAGTAELGDHVCSSGLGDLLGPCSGAGGMERLTFDEFSARASSHLLVITTLSALGVLMLLANLYCACVLQSSVRRAEEEGGLEIAPLNPAGADDALPTY